jgi:hypothetical protein
LARHLAVDDDGDGRRDRTVSIATPIFHAMTLLADFGPEFWPLPSQQIAGHTLSGFAARDPRGVLHVAVFTHHAEDIQSRSDQRFSVALNLSALGEARPMRITQYRFDRDHNSYFAPATALRRQAAVIANPQEVERLTRILESGDETAIREALPQIARLDPASLTAIAPAFLQMFTSLKDVKLRDAAEDVVRGVFLATGAQAAYPKKTVEEIQERAELQATNVSTDTPDPQGKLRMDLPLRSNGAVLLRIEPNVEK